MSDNRAEKEAIIPFDDERPWSTPREDEESKLSPVDREWLQDCFLFHAPTSAQGESLFEVNAAAREFAVMILRHVPPSADRSTALRALREAKMWANSAVVLKGRR